MPTIYLVSANPFPETPLKIDIEQRSILDRLPASWSVKPESVARIGDVISDLRRYEPDIVHFSAHGSPTERLVLLNEAGEGEEVSRATIRNLFSVMRGNIRLVVLNACYSPIQAEMISENVDCVIALSRALKDTDAISYSKQFYEALAARRSVLQAHLEASIVLTDVAPEQKPTLLRRGDVDPDTVFIGAQPRRKSAAAAAPKAAERAASYADTRKAAFEEAAERYGVSARRFTVLKISNPDGSFVARYEVEELRSLRNEISALHWRFISPSALVMAPTLDDDATNDGISWVTKSDPPPASFEDVLKNLGSLHGIFVFDPPLRPGRARSFAWTIKVLNGDALTAWEFQNLYSKQLQVHVSEKPLIGKPSEYFACVAWFPVEELQFGLRLPPSQTSRPQFRYFELKKIKPEEIPAEQVIREGELWAHPNYDLDWAKQNVAWQRNDEFEGTEGLSTSSAQAELVVPYPVQGSYYSLDWTLPDPPLPQDIDRLSGETEEVRKGLLAHRSARFPAAPTQLSTQVQSLFAAVHQEAREFLDATEPTFGTTIMTWDRQKRRMVVVEVCRNKGEPKDKDWEFWLPFGLGLAGMCYRTAVGAIRYRRELDRADPERPENYLPVPGSDPHAFLMSLPIDHPEMTEEMGKQPNAQRCRQLVGVLSIGSASAGSHLRKFCAHEDLTDQQFEELRDFREKLQRRVDEITQVLLADAGLVHSTGMPAEEPPRDLQPATDTGESAAPPQRAIAEPPANRAISIAERNRVIKILCGLDVFESAASRRTALELANLGQFVPRLSLDATIKQFVSQLVLMLQKFGPLDDQPDLHALGALLTSVIDMDDLPFDQRKFLARIFVECGLSRDRNQIEDLKKKYQVQEAAAARPAAQPVAAAAAAPAFSGIIVRPKPEWKSPVLRNRFQFKVAALDFDGTLLRGEKFVFSWELIWQKLGFGKMVQNELRREYRRQSAAARNHEERVKAYQQWCDLAVEKFKSRGLTREQLRAMSSELRLTNNCREALRKLREEGVVTALISGGVDAVLEDTFPDYRNCFDFVFMNHLVFSDSGALSGVRATAYDFEGKADALALVCQQAGASRDEAVFVGDHFNDEAVMLQVKKAIAYPPSDAVAETASNITIQQDDLLSVIPHILVS